MKKLLETIHNILTDDYMKSFTRALFFILLMITLVFVLMNFVRENKIAREETLYSSDEYNIVFMENSLFYFCKLEEFNSEYIRCNDPYYIVRKKDDTTKEDRVFVTTPSEEEVFQPEGPIFLAKDKVVYIAKVGSKSSVLEYINSQN